MIVLVQLAATEFINSMKLSNSKIVEKRIVFESHKSNQYVTMQQLITPCSIDMVARQCDVTLKCYEGNPRKHAPISIEPLQGKCLKEQTIAVAMGL